ncbi:helix-turn-helix transcriptional regulator [Paenibacillus sp. JSM ZJ436]|uniref:helix-turn-helix transcriptional regulator n=1 Tax=Paenibacillus sp. JSM ZJ436 TaxID=3376190 RepID=UPI0037895B1F
MKYSYLKKLFMYSLFLGALPVIVMGVFSYDRTSTVVEQKVNEANRQILSSAMNSIDHKLETAYVMATQFTNSTQAVSALNMDLDRSQFETVSELIKTIQGFQVFDYVASVHFVNLEKRWVITNKGLERLDEEEELAEWTALLSEPRNTQWVTSASGGISLIKPLPFLTTKSPPQGAFVMRFSPRLFNSLVRSESYGDTVIYNENMELIFRNSETLSSPEQQDQLELKLSAESGENSQQEKVRFELAGAPALAMVEDSVFNGWKYVSLVHLSDITEESKAIGWVTLLMCLVILSITLGLAWQGSKMFYSPIRVLRDLVADSDDAHPQASDELQYIRTGIQGLLGNKLELQKQLQKQFPYLHELFVMKLFLGQWSNKEIQEHIERYNIDSDWEQFSVFTLKIYSLEHTRFEEEDLSLILYAILNMMEEILTPLQPFKPVIMNESCAAVFVSPRSAESAAPEELLMQTCKEIEDKILAFLGLDIQLGVSRPHTQLEQVSMAFAESTAALRFCQRTGYRGVMKSEDVDPGRLPQMTYPAHWEQELLEALQSEDREAAKELVDRILTEVETRQYTLMEAQVLFYQLLVKMMSLLQWDEQTLKKMLLDVEYVQAMFRTTTFVELGQWFTSVGMEQLFQLLSTREESHQGQIAQQIKQLVQSRFEENLTLEAIADLMNFNANYLSRVFKKEVGMSFSEYMAITKLEMAKHLLTTSDLKVQEVAEKLHYQSTTAFIRYFRKMEGMTPSSYRKMNE